ncbi:hypothetical protein D3C75_1183410 [compost metagenome]
MVVTYTRSNTFREPVSTSSRLIVTEGASSGSVICRKDFHAPAPSILALSLSSGGIP